MKNWTKTYQDLLNESKSRSLNITELENFALAAFLVGRDAQSHEIFEQVYKGFANQNRMGDAARTAFLLGMILMDVRESARAAGWFATGERALNASPNVPLVESGLFLIPKALQKLHSGNPKQALELFTKATQIGVRFDDPALVSMGRMGQGQSLIRDGKITEGIHLLDETLVYTGSHVISPIILGIVYCAGIDTCRKVWDLKRAQEWTQALNRWCTSQSDMIPFRGQCLVNKAEISQFHGDWAKALHEADEAVELLTRPPARSAAGEAFYRKGELLRLMGKLEEAEKNYIEAAKWGKSIHPGLTLLRLAQHQWDAAQTMISHALLETQNTMTRVGLLPTIIHIMLGVDQIDKALEAYSELEQTATANNLPYLHAIAQYCAGEISISKGDFYQALENLQNARNFWDRWDLPYESAKTRELKGITYLKLGDKDNAEVEIAVAKWIYDQLNAIPDQIRLNQTLHPPKTPASHSLSLRELQVLQHVAQGKTNKTIASELFISPRTVDRHVSNIFNKLGVSSRVEATTLAIKHNIVDVEI